MKRSLAVLALVGLLGCPGADKDAAPTGTSSPSPTPTAALGAWRRIANHAPVGEGQTAVWTGRDILVWSGRYRAPGQGAAFNPRTGKWREIARHRVGGVGDAVTVWTGREMIVWGGVAEEDQTAPNIGAAYDPATDRWRRIATSPLSGGVNYEAVWTGKELVIWGIANAAEGLRAEAAVYTPSSNRWETIEPGPLGVRSRTVSVYTGKEMLIWGGLRGDAEAREYFTDGAAFDPATRMWRELSDAPLEGRSWASGTWIGGRLMVFGGERDDRFYNDVAAYDPKNNTWERLPDAPIDGRRAASIVWAGSHVVVWSGLGSDASGALTEVGRKDGAAFDLQTSSWRRIAAAPLSPRAGAHFIWTGQEVIAYGGCCVEDHIPYSNGAAFTP